ncbi:uncharacterized protein METZ01_LOCUS507982 [marine metagenome]|uniref:Uncharacterized protein n=1 Tax=marine metagenome TaxID=408172 RepID=A0A383EG90_9ZZZZ
MNSNGSDEAILGYFLQSNGTCHLNIVIIMVNGSEK